jgi:hypothetical protein
VGKINKSTGGYKMNQTIVPQALNEHEAASMLCLAVQTLRNARHLRMGCPYIKIGRSVRYLLSDVEEYLQKNRIDPEQNQ